MLLLIIRNIQQIYIELIGSDYTTYTLPRTMYPG